MANISVKFEDGTSHTYNNVPDSVNDEQVVDRALKEIGKPVVGLSRGSAAPAPKKDSSFGINLPTGALAGAADIGATILSPIDWAARKMGAQNVPILQDIVGFEPGERRRLVEKTMVEMGADPEAFGYQLGKVGTQIAGTAGAPGAIARPFIAAERAVPVAGTVGRAIESAGFNVPQAGGRVSNAAIRVGGGATAGGAAAGMVNPEDIEAGAMGGGLFGALSKPITAGIEKAVNVGRRFMPVDTQTRAGVNQAQIQAVADQLGIDIRSVTPSMQNFIQKEADKALRAGRELDVAALARSADFEELGMKPLLGQITRDPTQFAQERNLRGAGTGIQERLTEQNRALQNLFGRGAEGVAEPYQAGQMIAGELGKQESEMAKNVGSLYKAARESAGKDLEVPMSGLASEYGRILDEYGTLVPSGVRNQFQKFGLEGMKQTKLFTVEEADKLLKVINKNVGSDKATNTALGELRNAVKDSVMGVDASGGVFAPAVAAAKQRFQTLEQIPAMQAVLEGTAPEKFVSQFITKGSVDDVKRLANALQRDPQVFQQAKSQMAADIQRAAFGENITADSAIRPEMLARKLREIGTEKMSAFFSPDEINRYNTAMRVANYIEKHPNAAPVNTSNTLVSMLMQSPLVSGLERIPGVGATIGLAKAGAGAIQKQAATSRAMNAAVPSEAIGLTDAQRKLMAKALGRTGAAVGVFSQ
jgi:hypothetical protein